MAYHHGNLRAALLAAAVQILDEEGVGGLTLRAVARRAGVSHQAPYNHFASVDALLAAVAEEGFTRLLAELEAVTDPSPVRAMQETGIRYVSFAVSNRSHFRIMFGPQLSRTEEFPDLARVAARTFEALSRPAAAVFSLADEEGREEGASQPGDPRPLLWSLVHGLAHLLIDGQLTEGPADARAARDLAAQFTERLWFGIAPDR